MPTSPVSCPVINAAYLPENPLYGGAATENTGTDAKTVGWELSPAPFKLSEAQHQDLTRLGEILLKFMQAVDLLYKQSQPKKSEKPQMPGWIADLLNQGKPEALLQFAGMKRFKSHLPLVLRPDLLLGEDGWTLCEIDAVPGGIGFTSALNDAYRKSGFDVLEAPETMPEAWLAMLKAFAPEKENPVIAVVLSDEASDYRAEMTWLVEKIRETYPNIALIHPKDVDLVRDQLVFQDAQDGAYKAIDVIYRFFELFDLPNIPKMELIQYAVKKGLVVCTPPFKPHVEEKLTLALLHHPALAAFWKTQLGEADFAQLKAWVPHGWVVDPTPLPPQAVIANLEFGDKAGNVRVTQSFEELKTLSQKERELVLKPSGFSPLGWGSRGVTIGHDHSGDVWSQKLDEAMASFGKTPFILQKFEPAGVHEAERINLETGEVTPFKARTRLCPYYFVTGDKVVLAGVLATSCPSDKKLIHGMKDAVLAPVMIEGDHSPG